MGLSTLIAFSLISLLNCQEIPKLEKFENFHSRVAVRRKDAEISTVTFIEEFWDLKEGRGRLDTTRSNLTIVLLYDSKRTFSQYIGYDCISGILPDGDITDWSENLSDEAIVDVDKKNALIIGPSAAWRKAIRASNNKKATYNQDNNVRGIKANSWTWTENELTFQLFFAADEWKTSAKDAPLRITISGKFNDKSIDFVFDYYVFEKFDSTYYKFMPLIGIGCEQNQSNPEKILPRIPWSDFVTELEIVETSNLNDNSISFGPLRVSLYMDLKLNISRTDITFLTARESIIHDLNRDIIYNKNPTGDCYINPKDPTGLDLTEKANKIKSVSQLILLDRDYYYLGLTFVRGVFTDVWESVSFNETVDGTLLDKVVITYYITAVKGELLDSLGNQLPLKFVRTGYTRSAEGEYKFALRQEFNVFNFQKLYYGKNFQDVFNIRNCIIDDNDQKYFIFSSDLDDHLNVMDRRYAPRFVNLIKSRLTSILTDKYKVSPLRIPIIDFSYQNTSISIEALVLERPSLLSSFDKKDDRKPSSRDSRFPVKDINACIETTIKRKKSTGFKYCNKNCFVIDYDPNEKTDEIEDKDCEFYVLRSINVAGSVLLEEPTLDSLKNKLFETRENLIIDVKDWKNKTTEIPVKDIVVSDKTTSLMSSELLYTRSVPETRLLIKDSSDEFAADTLGDCYTLCKNFNDLQCQTFSFCASDKKCRLSSVLISDDTDTELLKNETESKEECNVYTMNFMKKYELVPGKRALLNGFLTLSTVDYPYQCARTCSTQGPCLSFQFCDTGKCAVSRHAFQDFTDSELSANTTSETCHVYEAKSVNLFVVTGKDLVDEKIEETRENIGVEDCAKLCYEMQQEPKRSCLSFNFCPTTSTRAHSYCQLSSASVLRGAKTVKNNLCNNFDRNTPAKNKTIPEIPKPREQSSSNSNKMSNRSFMGLIFGMFFVGLVLGVIAFFGYTTYKRRREDADGFGVSVRFIRHQDE